MISIQNRRVVHEDEAFSHATASSAACALCAAVRAEFQNLDRSTVRRVYSGKPGCGCGCNGTYFEDARNINRVCNIMLKRIDEVRAIDGLGEDRRIFSIEDDSRYFWVYVR